MNSAEFFIAHEYVEGLSRAEACLNESRLQLLEDECDPLDIIDDCRWAISVIVTEKVLLEAFKETQATSLLPVSELILLAQQKASNASFIREIMEYLQSIQKIPDEIEVDFESIQGTIQHGFKEVVLFLKNRKRKREAVKR